MSKTSKIISLAAVLLLTALILPFPLSNVATANTCATYVWVAPPPVGSDGNPGTQSQPFATIQKGIDNVCTDGTVFVAAGTYVENLFIYGATNLTGAGAQSTIIDGGGFGTGVCISSGPVTNMISGFTIQNGAPFGSSPGGGIYINGSHIVTVNDCTIKSNQCELGGGIFNRGQLYMNRCTVSGNTATYQGGGIDNDINLPGSGNMWLTNCTISGNTVTYAYGMGAGIYNAWDMTLLNVTIANNTATGNASRGGGFANVTGNDTAFFKNCIVANNAAGTANTNNGYSQNPVDTRSQGHNLDSENNCLFDEPTDLVNVNPQLGPLQDNGGPTFTHALLQGSPAIDAGDNNGAPSTDQRGVSRPQGTYVDIGAFELEQSEIPETTEAHPSVSPAINWTRNLNPPTMSVQFVSVNPQQATANQPVTISTNVVNTGDQGGNLSVALKINGQVEETRMVSVGPQASQPIKFTVTKSEPGTYSIDIGGQTGSFTIPDTGKHRAPVNAGLVAFIILVVLILATMVLLLSRRPA